MTAISKTWVTVADSAVDADSPLDQALMTALRDDLVHLREWIGASYTAGAVQNHNHDGVNSAVIDIGPNFVRNGSFEDGLNGWTQNPYSGGSIGTNTANDLDGTTAASITSSSTVNGGGYVLSALTKCGGLAPYRFACALRASVANVSSRVEVVWYDDTQSQISVGTIYDSTNTPSTATLAERAFQAPSTARYFALRLTGGVPGAGSSAGTIYFDGAFAGSAFDSWVQAGDYRLQSNDALAQNGTGSYVKTHEILSGVVGTLRIKFTLASSNATDGVNGRIYINGVAVGTERLTTSGTGVEFSEDVSNVATRDLIQVYARQASGSAIANVTNFRLFGDRPASFVNVLP
jgi:hypothetical protein